MNTLNIIDQEFQIDADDLRRMIGPDPHRPGPDRARLIDHGIPVWAIIGHILTVGDATDPTESTLETISQVAHDYAIPTIAVVAALRYYAEYRAAIDTRLAINAANAA